MRIGQRAGATDTGRKRRRNEDSFVVRPPLFAVADGMGGAQAGEIASRLATEALGDSAPAGTAEERVVGLVQGANRRVYERSAEDAAVSGMGTTITLALVEDGLVTIGHVGDSRAYLVRDGSLEQLTQDHSLVAELMRSGKLSPEEAESHPQRSVITRALGTDPDVDVDVFTLEARPGDVFLLCSDGLTSMVGDDVILGAIEASRDDLDAAARTLIARANRGGGEDNITVVCFEIAEGEDAPAAEASPEETVRLPAVDAAAAEPDDEETLDELDRVPAVDTMVVPPEQAARFAARPDAPPDRLDAIGRRVLVTLAILALVLGALALLFWGLS
ncbi:MAG TPA: Stp1/IreP family PP2C-type Ser/Thr phosphatase [Gaiellaceae bacterium]|nr:Stp1/IreP family PP2C-type Ser/Thr phosphatase [Gaiellaceae bacterium]